MLKKKDEIQTLLATLYEVVKVGEQKDNQHITALITELDNLTDEIVQEYGYTPRERLRLGGNHGSEKTKELNRLKNQIKINPACGLILGVNALCDNIGDRIQDTLGTHVMDVKYSRSLCFKLYGDDLGCVFSSFMSPGEIEAEKQKIKKAMEGLGFVCNENQEMNSLENHAVLKKYLTELGVERFSCNIEDDLIDKIYCQLSASEYPWYQKEEEPEPEPEVSSLLTEPDVYNIKKDLKNYMYAVSSFEFVEDENLMIGLFRSYLSSIENALSQPLKIAQAVEAEHRKSRTENISANDYQKKFGEEYFLQYHDQMNSYFWDMETRLREAMKESTFAPLDTVIKKHACLEFQCVPDPFPRKNSQLDPMLDCQWDEVNHSYRVSYTDQSRMALNKIITKYLPHAEIRKYHVDENNIIHSFDVVDISFIDLESLFKQTTEKY